MVMLFDCGFEIYVWVGLASKVFSEEAAANIAKQYMAKFRKKDRGIYCHRILEGGKNEMMEFFMK